MTSDPDRPDAPAIDLAHLERLRLELDDGDPESSDPIVELLELFERNSRRIMADLEESVAMADLDGMADYGHQLVSTSAWVGANQLSAIARSIENAARQGRGDDANAAVAAARTEMARVHEAMRDLQGTGP